ncbi:hypothetical protein Fmac_018914 [Flemingia macrophylla]|uniref:Uncharacterized protein n=1 Tax=Flemingia macrophylla TaxID=520843 RepID=A0ABD1M6C1_9FABA
MPISTVPTKLQTLPKRHKFRMHVVTLANTPIETEEQPAISIHGLHSRLPLDPVQPSGSWRVNSGGASIGPQNKSSQGSVWGRTSFTLNS